MRPSTTSIYIISSLTCFCFLLLSIWQLQRALEKYQILQIHQQTGTVTSAADISKATVAPYQKQRFNLEIDQKRYLLIDGIQNRQSVYRVIGISQIPTSKDIVLVDLGWTSQKTNAQKILKIRPQTIEWIPIKGFLLTLQRPVHSSWPLHLNHIDRTSLEKTLKNPIIPFIAASQESLLYQATHDEKAHIGGIARHISYSIQFLIFGILCVTYRNHLLRNKS